MLKACPSFRLLEKDKHAYHVKLLREQIILVGHLDLPNSHTVDLDSEQHLIVSKFSNEFEENE